MPLPVYQDYLGRPLKMDRDGRPIPFGGKSIEETIRSDLLELLVAELPRALVSLDEIAAKLGIPRRDTIRLIVQAKGDRLVEFWEQEDTLLCLLSSAEASRRSLWLHAKTGRKAGDFGSADWSWTRSDELSGIGRSRPGRRESRYLDKGRVAAVVMLIRHYAHNDDPPDDYGSDWNDPPDVPRRTPAKRKQIRWRSSPPMTDDEIRAYLYQNTKRPRRRRMAAWSGRLDPAILVGLGVPLWRPMFEGRAGESCLVCRGRELSGTQICLGCCRSAQ